MCVRFSVPGHTFELLSDVTVHVARVDSMQEIDVFVRVELRHLSLGRGFGSLRASGGIRWLSADGFELAYEYLHFLVEAVVHD